MNEEQRLVYVRGMILQAEITVNAMIVDNNFAEKMGLPLPHNGDAFRKIIDTLGIHHNSLITELLGH